MKRIPISKSTSRKIFRAHAKRINIQNISPRPMRGGIRL